ncbi:sigma-70 family RNA polymerase sigma factor [Flagellatimonas centrodinii]|uniref:RNA polymerase sigma factor n=1 Tax=Flagellatimonas centrodinii TaxID=2806210 RepID=UPI001FED69BE|nr:sigma-70 family RNA polymerase sigma factor [Flagellatimonas centrodinii]ULQ47669.1 sigma-70 family RNA polymerase sigma factor [Flagellatimonas centrodinii]
MMADPEQKTAGTGPAAGAARPMAPQQLEALARRYRGALVSYFSKRLSNTSDAEDLTQEVFIRMARHQHVDDIAHIESYLFQTASNLLRDYLRRSVTHHVTDHVSIEDCGYDGEVPSEERVYEGRAALDDFMALLDELPPRRREVFLMHRFMGMSYGAIALKLGISVSVVEKHMMKALLQFSERLGPL